MIAELTNDEQQLLHLMSEISERCYAAGWMYNLEYVLWDALTSGSRKYGHDEITPQEIDRLQKLSKRTGTWIAYDGANEAIAVPLQEWKVRFDQGLAGDPHKLSW